MCDCRGQAHTNCLIRLGERDLQEREPALAPRALRISMARSRSSSNSHGSTVPCGVDGSAAVLLDDGAGSGGVGVWSKARGIRTLPNDNIPITRYGAARKAIVSLFFVFHKA